MSASERGALHLKGPAWVVSSRSGQRSAAASPIGRALGALVVLSGLAGAGALLTYGRRAIDGARSSATLCSDPGVLATLRDLVAKDPNWIVIGAYYGSFANIRLSFHSVRTLNVNQGSPVRGSACAAMMHVAAIDRGKAGLGDRDLSDVDYTVEYVDGSSTEYVVVVH